VISSSGVVSKVRTTTSSACRLTGRPSAACTPPTGQPVPAPVAVSPAPSQLGRWLREHQGAEVACRDGARLDYLANTGLAPLTGLARAPREDRPAVAQGITTSYNSGVDEGRITDAKLQKRLMGGRAGVFLSATASS
jgi:hypothetical protein